VNDILEQVERIVSSSGSGKTRLQKIVDLLHREVEGYDWVGFYLTGQESEKLVLGPFSGAPTEHTEIGYGEGICGQAADTGETFLVEDVSSEQNYLSCSPEVKSEIVVPIFFDGDLVGEIDIDSHEIDNFSREDEELLDKIAGRVAGIIDS